MRKKDVDMTEKPTIYILMESATEYDTDFTEYPPEAFSDLKQAQSKMQKDAQELIDSINDSDDTLIVDQTDRQTKITSPNVVYKLKIEEVKLK